MIIDFHVHMLDEHVFRASTNRTVLKNTCGKKPSEFLCAFHYDTCVYDPQVLKVLLQRVGADRLVMGSDYPVGAKDPVAFIKGCTSLD